MFKGLVGLVLLFSSFCIAAEQSATVTVKPEKVIRTINKGLIMGGNVAIWHKPESLSNERIRSQFRNAHIGLIRMPGGSTSDQYFWNGNGVRQGNNTPDAVDKSKFDWKTRRWNIDYSAWAPGFIGYWGFPEQGKAELQTWHGNCDVRDQLEFIKSVGATPLICVNAGTGMPQDAAEWVKWANKKQGYGVRFWEIGNELEGGWESGHIRPDGKPMNGEIYARLFLDFAKAMRKADPKIMIGGPTGAGAVAESWIPDLLRIAGNEVDFISYHDYYTSGAGTIEQMFAKLDTIKKNVSGIKKMVRQYQPKREKKILIGLTEWNCKLFEDENTADLFSGLWTAAAFGEMFESEIDYATHWDSFTVKETGGGHGFMLQDTAEPLAQFRVFDLIGREFGETILEADSSKPALRTYASKNAKGELLLLAVNTGLKDDIRAGIDLGRFVPAPVAKAWRFSQKEYRWNKAGRTEWNTGAAELTVPAAEKFSYTVPAFSFVLFKFAPRSGSDLARLNVLGRPSVVLPLSGTGQAKVLVLDAQGKPAAGAALSVSADAGFTVPASVVSGPDGVAVIELKAPAQAGQANLKISLKDTAESVLLPLKAVVPVLRIVGPSEIPVGQAFSIEAVAGYEEGGFRVFESVGADCSLSGLGTQSAPFVQGVARFELTGTQPGPVSLKAGIEGTTVASPVLTVRVFAEVDKEKVVLQFDNDSDMAFVAGTGPFELDRTVKPNQGVLKIPLKAYKGWVQEKVNLKDFNKITSVNWAKVTAVSFDIMVPADYDPSGSWGQMVFALQSTANYWMPVKEVSLAELPKGKWVRLTLPIEKQEFRNAMHSFFQIMVIFNSGEAQSGTVYLDNIGFVEKVEK